MTDESTPAAGSAPRTTTFVLRLLGPRPDFAQTLTAEEREVMGRHAAYWRPYLDSGQMVVFGPVLDDAGSYGLGVVETEDEEGLRAFAAADPVVTTGTAQLLVGTMLAGFVRPSSAPADQPTAVPRARPIP